MWHHKRRFWFFLFRFVFFFFLVFKTRTSPNSCFKIIDQSSFLLAFCPQYYQLKMLCTFWCGFFVKHSAPGIFSVRLFFFWWHSEGSQSPGDERRDGLTWRFPQWDSKASPWGRDKRGLRGRICLSLRDVAVERGRDRRRWRCGVSCYLLLRFCRTP